MSNRSTVQLLAGMGRRAPRKTAKRSTIRRRGKGWFSNIANKIWSGLKSGANYVKDNKLISKGLALIPDARAKAAAAAAGSLGLGRPRKRVTRKRVRRGGNLRSIFSKAHTFAKDNRILSNFLKKLGHNRFSAIAHAAGYGRKRRTRTRRYRR